MCAAFKCLRRKCRKRLKQRRRGNRYTVAYSNKWICLLHFQKLRWASIGARKQQQQRACKQSDRHQSMFLRATGFVPATTTVCDVEEVKYKYSSSQSAFSFAANQTTGSITLL